MKDVVEEQESCESEFGTELLCDEVLEPEGNEHLNDNYVETPATSLTSNNVQARNSIFRRLVFASYRLFLSDKEEEDVSDFKCSCVNVLKVIFV